MTTSTRYEARIDRDDQNRAIVVDSLSENHAVVDIPAGWGDAFIGAAQSFLDAGIARYGSIDEFERACLWHNGLDAAIARMP